ncbi:hypothetical protein HN832_00535 [archaeon]|mgnify:CR=1 FL=1|jgi:hypothetical protein|nr:hypothetical protein [archaeon]MBT7128155.1 hypothetical protein [archaeon]MBT7281880.1 hypothetical protein [archaeon]
MRNKKAELSINIPLEVWLILILTLIIVGFGIITYDDYSRQKEIGNLWLGNLTISGDYGQLAGKNTITNISTMLNGTNLNEEVSVKTLFYINGNNIGFYSEKDLDKIQFPYEIENKEIDTAEYYVKYKNNFEICREVEIRYKNLNFWRFIPGFGSPVKKLKNCQTFSGMIENK